ncbi:hypothetical protein QYZ88_013270 [Lachnospiraceae bacterium C1.1]|nr:hypothetical protein [Lachnospiraceae bacterium C1.1]
MRTALTLKTKSEEESFYLQKPFIFKREEKKNNEEQESFVNSVDSCNDLCEYRGGYNVLASETNLDVQATSGSSKTLSTGLGYELSSDEKFSYNNDEAGTFTLSNLLADVHRQGYRQFYNKNYS